MFYYKTLQSRVLNLTKRKIMKGKILGLGAISGEDGNRYGFEVSDIANLENRNPDSLAGCEVDFEVDGNVAKSIFITSGGLMNIGNIQGQLMANDARGVRFKFLLATGLTFVGGIFSLIPLIGWVIGPICVLVGFVVMVFAVIGVSRASESKTLLRNFIIAMFVMIISVILAFVIGGGELIAAISGYGSINGTGIIVAFIIIFLGAIATFIAQLLFAHELAFVTGQKFLLWAQYANILAGLTMVILIGYLLAIVAFALWVIGFVQMKEIRKRTDSDVMPWF